MTLKKCPWKPKNQPRNPEDEGIRRPRKNIDWGCLGKGSWEYLDIRGRKWQEAGEVCIMRSFITCTLHQILLEGSNTGGWDGRCMEQEWERWEMNREFWWENLKGRTFGRPSRAWEDNIRMYLMDIWREVVNWIHLARGRNPWQTFVNTAMNLRVP